MIGRGGRKNMKEPDPPRGFYDATTNPAKIKKPNSASVRCGNPVGEPSSNPKIGMLGCHEP
jgi:hypothetical protein